MAKRALVVEDENDIASLIDEIMSLDAITSLHAVSGDDAMEQLQDNEVDFAVVDYQLPDTNGIELYQNIVKDHPELARRFVFMSGYNPDSELGEFLRETNCRFVHKPFRINEFRSVIKEML